MRAPFPKALWGWNAPNDPAQVLTVEPEADMVAKPRASADPNFTVRIAHSLARICVCVNMLYNLMSRRLRG